MVLCKCVIIFAEIFKKYYKKMENLVKTSTYARYKRKSVETIRLWIKKGKIAFKIIDEMYFVYVNDKEYEEINKLNKKK